MVRDILNDIYTIDPSLREKENDLIKIIKGLLELKPDVKIDDSFKNSLRNQILEKARERKYVFMKPLAFASLVFVLMLLVVIPFLNQEPEKNAFGELVFQNDQVMLGRSGGASESFMALKQEEDLYQVQDFIIKEKERLVYKIIPVAASERESYFDAENLLKVENLSVYDRSGNVMFGSPIEQLKNSLYVIETDFSKILAKAKEKSLSPLGIPEYILLKYDNYLIPGLSFPVLETERRVVVPLLKSFFEN